MIKGESSDNEGLHPKKVGRALTPVDINASGVAGIDGNCLCVVDKNFFCRSEVTIKLVPLFLKCSIKLYPSQKFQRHTLANCLKDHQHSLQVSQ